MSPTAVAEPTALGELRAILELEPSPLNPRKHFDKTKLEELAASIVSKGILEPLLVRPHREDANRFEIVAGERRYRAAKMAKHDVVPIIIRQLTDVEVLELMAIENSQRDDLHPLEEADGFKALMKADASYTPKAIAAKIGKSERYVHQRLQLARLEAPVKKAFLDGHIQAGHADLISRLKPADQTASLKACFHNLFGDDKEQGCISVRQLDHWIEANVRLVPGGDDPQIEYFPELADNVADAAKILQVAGSYIPPSEMAKELPGVVPHEAYRRVQGKKDHCKHAERAVVVIGTGRGKIIEICRARTDCKTHYKWEIDQAARDAQARKASTSKRGTSVSPRAKEAEQKARETRTAELARKNLRETALEAIEKRFRERAPAKPSAELLALIVEALPWYNTKRANTWKAVALECVGTLRSDCFSDLEYKRLARLVKPFGIDVPAIEKALAAKGDVSQTSAKKAAKK